jgi:hypothetical protein
MALPRGTPTAPEASNRYKSNIRGGLPVYGQIKTLLLAEKYGTSLLQNLAIDSIVAFFKNCGGGRESGPGQLGHVPFIS